MGIKSDFDFARYVGYQLSKPLSFCFVLQYEQELVGFLSIYFYDEAPPPQIKEELEMLEESIYPASLEQYWVYMWKKSTSIRQQLSC
jgi:hypothetical protein